MGIYVLFLVVGAIVVTSLVACSSSSLTCKLFDKNASEAT